MTRWDGAIPSMAAFAVAAVLFLPFDAAHADLLGGLTDVLDETVETAETVVDDTVETTAGRVDDTLGSTGTGLDEPVDDLSDVAVTTSDGLTDAVGQTADDLAETIDDASTALLPTEDAPPTTTPTSTTTSFPRDAADASALPATGDAALPPTSRTTAHDPGESVVTTTARTSEPRPGDSAIGFASETLTVLSATGEFTHRPVPEPVRLGPELDSSLYGRLLAWLTSAGSGFGALLLGPLLALEIVIRALLSAGSGLVAPISLLGAYLVSLIWRAHGSPPIARSS